MPLILYQAKILNIFTKWNIWNLSEQAMLKLKILVFSSKIKQPDAPKRVQFEWKLKTNCTQIIKNKVWLMLNVGHTFHSMLFDIVHPLNWFWSEAKKDLQRPVQKSLSSVCCWRVGRWKGTLCFWRAASCSQWHLPVYEGAQHTVGSQCVSDPGQFGTVRAWQGREEQLNADAQDLHWGKGCFTEIHRKQTNKASHKINEPYLKTTASQIKH